MTRLKIFSGIAVSDIEKGENKRKLRIKMYFVGFRILIHIYVYIKEDEFQCSIYKIMKYPFVEKKMKTYSNHR